MAAHHSALAYAEEGQLAEAELLLKLAIELGRKSLGPDHPFVSGALYNLAMLYARQNRFADAEPLLVRSLGIRLRQYGSENPAV
jgi:tetratricopeptide (TPR) repeat protein